MRMTLDDALYRQALALADPDTAEADLFREAIKTFIQVRTGERLATLGGMAPDMNMPPRRQPATKTEQP